MTLAPSGFEPLWKKEKGRRAVWSSSCWDGTTFRSGHTSIWSAVPSDIDMSTWRNGVSLRVRQVPTTIEGKGETGILGPVLCWDRERSGRASLFLCSGTFVCPMMWPKELPALPARWEHPRKPLKAEPPFRLHTGRKDVYAFYFRKLGFGFGQAIEINTYTHGPSRLQVVGVKWLSGNVSGPTADGSQRTTKNPYSLNWKVTREAFYATKEAALGAIEGKRYLKGTKTLPIEPLTVREVRQALEARQARRRAKAKP